MNDILRYPAIITAALLLSGCVSANMEKQVQAFEFGPAPSREQIERTIPAYFQTVLKDPFSAHYQSGAPYKAWLAAGLIQGGGVLWEGWAVDVAVNAKNSFGAYTGWRPYHVIFTNGVPVNAYEVTPGPDVMWHPL